MRCWLRCWRCRWGQCVCVAVCVRGSVCARVVLLGHLGWRPGWREVGLEEPSVLFASVYGSVWLLWRWRMRSPATPVSPAAPQSELMQQAAINRARLVPALAGVLAEAEERRAAAAQRVAEEEEVKAWILVRHSWLAGSGLAWHSSPPRDGWPGGPQPAWKARACPPAAFHKYQPRPPPCRKCGRSSGSSTGSGVSRRTPRRRRPRSNPLWPRRGLVRGREGRQGAQQAGPGRRAA